MERIEYFLGLDIGTSSVGFAVTDINYNIIRKGKKNFWGTRLFEEGQTALDRRVKRAGRRRLQRRKERIKHLQTLFAVEISKVDPDFFMRLEESMYHFEDKSEGLGVYSLFNDKNYTDKDFHRAENYPTVFHLRKALLEGKVNDVRLLYLGLAHIIKNRGHFLFEGENLSSVNNFKQVFENLEIYIEENYNIEFKFADLEKVEETLKRRTLSLRDKEKQLLELLIEKDNFSKTLIKLILGMSVDLVKLYDNLDVFDVDDETFQKRKISFKGKFEEEAGELESLLGEHFSLIELGKAIYDWALLTHILADHLYLSSAKIALYEDHKRDLKALKALVKKYQPGKYNEIFVAADVEHNYPAYIGMTKKNGKKQIVKSKKCSQEDLCKFLKKHLESFEGNIVSQEDRNSFEAIVAKIEQNILFAKPISKENGVIPYQIHQVELKQILKVNIDKFPFLKESDGNLTIAEKIIDLHTYRIPYYVGPLNNHSKYAWLVKKANEKISPWNFDKVVDIQQSAENFIMRMTNKCSYIKNADVLPKHSLLYSKFMVLNELNNLKINGDAISLSLKQELFNEIFMKKAKVSGAEVGRYLIRNCYADKDLVLSGIDKDFKSNLKPYQDFIKIFGVEFVNQHEETIENIIRWTTLFSQSKNMLIDKIKESYPQISLEQLKQIKKLSYSGWGRLSKEFLTDIKGINRNTGEVASIIDALWDTNNNLMQLLSSDYSYLVEIQNANHSTENLKIELKDIEELYCSPAVKKSIWQAVQIVNEVEKVMKSKPTKLFIEMAREEGEKVRTTSRHKALLASYQAIKNEYKELYEELKTKDDKALQSKKLYLYFMQLGHCAYTGEKIDLDNLFNQNIYDIDHIYPRSKTKDDSLHNNLVLVTKSANLKKADSYPIPEELRQEGLWALWVKDKKNMLITQEKYDRLVRKTSFSDRELEGFIARSLVETRQSTKAVAEIFNNYYKNDNASDKKSKVVYVKARNVSDFRQCFDIVKVRELNDYHHAKDAYLSIVVGNVFDTKFTENFYKNIATYNYSLKPEVFYSRDILKGDYYAWKGDGSSISKIKEILSTHNILFTRQARKVSGALFKETIYKKNSDAKLAIKNVNDTTKKSYKLRDLTKYGGFKSVFISHFSLVEHTLRKKTIRTIEAIPLYRASEINSKEKLIDYFETRENKPLVNVKIIIYEIIVDSLIKIDSLPLHIRSEKGNYIGYNHAFQLLVDNKTENFIKYLYKLSKAKEIKIPKLPNNKYESSILINNNLTDGVLNQNSILYDLLSEKLENPLLKSQFEKVGKLIKAEKAKFLSLSAEEQCKTLVEILKIFQCNAARANLKIIEGSSEEGRILINKEISKYKKVELITQSVTGIYEKKIDLLTKEAL